MTTGRRPERPRKRQVEMAGRNLKVRRWVTGAVVVWAVDAPGGPVRGSTTRPDDGGVAVARYGCIREERGRRLRRTVGDAPWVSMWSWLVLAAVDQAEAAPAFVIVLK